MAPVDAFGVCWGLAQTGVPTADADCCRAVVCCQLVPDPVAAQVCRLAQLQQFLCQLPVSCVRVIWAAWRFMLHSVGYVATRTHQGDSDHEEDSQQLQPGALPGGGDWLLFRQLLQPLMSCNSPGGAGHADRIRAPADGRRGPA